MKTYNKPELEKVLFDTEEITTVGNEELSSEKTDQEV